ncbi:Kinesin family protein [Spraguea lophii 42_110]|uniref:Kinesin family protein n=1 Tax=Spraguea lophii (strain 42_110) TaxID=1358809 RepID=S7XJZ8_SPRLO|nr:Kinesin family protein [Spraguea lophii 42_110]
MLEPNLPSKSTFKLSNKILDTVKRQKTSNRSITNKQKNFDSRIKVLIRIKPDVEKKDLKDKKLYGENDKLNISKNNINFNFESKTYNYSFDKVFGIKSTQKDIFGYFETQLPLLQTNKNLNEDKENNCINSSINSSNGSINNETDSSGISENSKNSIEKKNKSIFNTRNKLSLFRTEPNYLIFCYGCTGSGKTYTMIGNKDNRSLGLIYRTIERVAPVEISYYEIYNEKIIDLIDGKQKQVYTHYQNTDSNGDEIKDLQKTKVNDLNSFITFINTSAKRSTAHTLLNDTSSRSHMILKIYTNPSITLVDLAGSEDNRKTDNKGERMVESTTINYSLYVLKNVINSINNHNKNNNIRIPHRDSKLTRILRIGENNKTYIIANIKNKIERDSVNTLNFATDSSKIKVKTNTEHKINRSNNLYDKYKYNNKANNNVIDYNGNNNIIMNKNKNISNNNITTHKNNIAIFSSKRNILSDKTNDSKTNNTKPKNNIFTEEELLMLLNTANFLKIKKIPGIGDKRAEKIIEYVNGGNFFHGVNDLENIFRSKFVDKIKQSIKEV